MRVQSINQWGEGTTRKQRSGIQLQRVAGISAGVMPFMFPTVHLSTYDVGNGQVGFVQQSKTGWVFTRNSTAWTRLSNGLWASVASGVPRSYYDTSGNFVGYLAEQEIYNGCLWSRDLTQAGSWTATDITPVKNVTGMDGVADSACTLTADANNGTIKQSITDAVSVSRTFSCWIKRVSGSGTVSISVNNFSTAANATINTSTWTRVSHTVNNHTNPVVGIKMATAGDVIQVDMCQEEEVNGATSPYPNEGSSLRRRQDSLTVDDGAELNTSEGTIWAFSAGVGTGGPAGCVLGIFGPSNNYIMLSFHYSRTMYDYYVNQPGGTNAYANTSPGWGAAYDRLHKGAAAYKLNDSRCCGYGIFTDLDTDVAIPPTLTSGWGVGQYAGSSGFGMNGSMYMCAYYPYRIPDYVLSLIGDKQTIPPS